MTDKKQIFPIKTNTSCLWKWAYSSVYLSTGETSSCTYNPVLKIPEDNFNNFHNLPEKIEDRQRMLKGLWPKKSCEYCKKIEDVGGVSERITILQRQRDLNDTPSEVIKDNSAVEVTPTMLEVWFRNTCNMSCVYCGPHFSSRWEEEIKLHGPINGFKDDNQSEIIEKNIKNKLYDQRKEQFWHYLKENNRFKTLRWFNLLGGEPLVLPELEECLDFWDDHPNENLTFQLHTNLKANDYRFNKFLDRVEKLTKQKKVYQFRICASLDGIGPEQEYVRYGLDIKQWNKNFERLLGLDNISLGINSVISSLTLHGFPSLLEKIVEWNEGRKSANRIVHSFAVDCGITTPYIFDSEVFKDIIQRCKKIFIVKNSADLAIKQRIWGVESRLQKSKESTEKIKELKEYLSVLDKRRNTDWKKTFPWLVNL